VARTIFIGDVHGCARELRDLLDKVGISGEDQVVFVGDLVARGPDTPDVLRVVREVAALCVRGNHEHRMILANAARKGHQRGPRLGPSHQALLDELDEQDWAQLDELPLSLEFPDHGIRVVHAGVVPNVPFHAQQAWNLMHLRSLTSRGAGSDRYSVRSWAEDYKEEPHIVFGHNAQAGLQLHEFATGLDTACVYGGTLTALVLQDNQAPPPPAERKDCIVAVKAHERYVDYGPRPGQ